MHWILQNDIYNEENFQHLVATLERFTLPYSVHKVVPFTEDDDKLDPRPMPPWNEKDPRVVVMGSYTLAHYAKRRGWKPGAWLDNLDFEIQYLNWRTSMLNHDALVCRFGDVPPQRVPFFLRPVADSKAFTGEVTDWPSYLAWRKRVEALTPEDRPTLTLDTPVMVCSKKEIYSETRTWVVDGKVVTCSGYKVGKIKRYTAPEQVDDAIVHFANECAQQWSPNRAYVLDVALTADGYTIGEVNNLNAAGWYRCDMQKLVVALEDMQP